MIKLVEYDGLLCPVFVCAACGEPIQDAPGIVQWDDHDQPATFVALHKGPQRSCAHSYELARGGRGSWEGWRDLAKFLDQLRLNTAHPFGELPEDRR